MHQTKLFWFLLIFTLIFTSCIKEFNPVIKSADEKKYVITGSVSNADSAQTVNISMTSPIQAPAYLPVGGCIVSILDDNGNTFNLSETGNGNYSAVIDQVYLTAGTSFKLSVTTPDGEVIESDYDMMTESPSVDSVYYITEDHEGLIEGEFLKGIQFYIDLDGAETGTRYYRWEASETWEYHADFYREWYYDGEIHHIWPPDSSLKVCWRTRYIPRIFTLTTGNLIENKFRKLPLHFVDNLTTKLAYGYSLLIKQYALSETAYTYWDQLRINSEEQGGLYETQPLAIQGNIHSITNPDKEVLGFFGASTVTTKRIFVQNVPNLELDFYSFCNPVVLRKGLVEIDPQDYPAFLMGDALGYFEVLLNDACVDCTELRGSTIKPDFWPN